MGRPPTPTEKLKLHGGLRDDRHASREKEPQASGIPLMPAWLSGEAKAHWEEQVPRLIEMGVVAEVDSPALVEMCEWWAELRKWRTGQRSATNAGKVNAMATCCRQWRELAFRFGVTAVERTKIMADVETSSDLAEEFGFAG